MLVNASRQELKEMQATKRACPRICIPGRALPGNSMKLCAPASVIQILVLKPSTPNSKA